jgi:hypothetical protein
MDDLTTNPHALTPTTEDLAAPPSTALTDAQRYRAILEHKIRDGARRAATLIQAIHDAPPRDQLLRTRAAGFAVDGTAGLRIGLGADWYAPTHHAFAQIAARAGVPLPYLRELAAPEADSWQHDLAAEILRRHYGHREDERVLVRSVRGQVRGWLSDKYRRIDCRPLVDALAQEAEQLGAVPFDGVATDTRVALKLVLPEILEPIPGEYMALGGEWSNSDYGNGAHSFRSFAVRVVCLNGMTGENLLKQVHLGGRLALDLELSERTHRLDTAANVSVLRDILRAALHPREAQRLIADIRAAHARTMTTAQLFSATKTFPKATQRSILDAFGSQDVVNLPPGNTAWRASNAISWVARHAEDPEQRLDLERAAASVV